MLTIDNQGYKPKCLTKALECFLQHSGKDALIGSKCSPIIQLYFVMDIFIDCLICVNYLIGILVISGIFYISNFVIIQWCLNPLGTCSSEYLVNNFFFLNFDIGRIGRRISTKKILLPSWTPATNSLSSNLDQGDGEKWEKTIRVKWELIYN